MRTRSLIPAATLLLGCSLRHRPVAPEPARGPARDSLFLLDQTRGDSVAARGYVDGSVALLGADVIYLRAGAPVTFGREAAAAVLSAAPGVARETMTWEPLGGGVSYDLNAAYTFGIAAHAARSNGVIRIDHYVAFWKRQRGEPWRIAAYAEIGAPSIGDVRLESNQLAPPLAAVPKQNAEVAASVRSADSLFSDLADRMGVPFAFSNTVAPNGGVFAGPRLIVGSEAIGEYFGALGAGTSLTWRPIYASAAASGDLAFTVGVTISTGRGQSGAAVQRFGKYLAVWQRQRNGTWKFLIQGVNATPPRGSQK
ncbi:MAG TPA: hypothetical protein VK636_13715 [Gemmatimonadaceae bacterium]|nr:hypothetical protein [Gemmatimonadaceae bacterium]